MGILSDSRYQQVASLCLLKTVASNSVSAHCHYGAVSAFFFFFFYRKICRRRIVSNARSVSFGWWHRTCNREAAVRLPAVRYQVNDSGQIVRTHDI